MAELDCVPTIWIATCRLTNHGRYTRRRLGEPLLQKLGHSTIIMGLWNGYLTRPYLCIRPPPPPGYSPMASNALSHNSSTSMLFFPRDFGQESPAWQER